MLELICILIGIALVIIGLSVPSTVALIVGVIFLAIGGVWVFLVDSDGDWF
ncbi:hypothetical protein [Kineosporia succinea]|uniref:Membrane protein implicated in regulation of membrane protease activity n=1 Tax=Kineosporia succinea TaxID=84632 RepID=A0ABT9P9Z2_9ACTN|nr:hypothetical protein [Kineosporia succinea]MDP9829366.1 membrane protein implicated in regulation of membrane protease activity [Kineosporia succinea]